MMGQWHQTNLTRNQIKAELFEFNKIRSDTNFIRIKSTFSESATSEFHR